MIDINIYSEKVEIAKQQKSNANYKSKIETELTKPDWQQRKFELDKTFSNIKDEQDFQKYQKALVKFFDDVYEVITAPGVDDFISWINETTDSKKSSSTRKLRDYLVENYTESNISTSIEDILKWKDGLVKEKSIFSPLLSEVTKYLKKICDAFLDKPAEFANNIDDFLDILSSNLEGINEIEEFSFTEEKQLYSDIDISENVEYYFDIIKLIVDKNQSLKPINESEKSLDLISKVQNRISDIKECIVLLNSLELANNDDATLKALFLKFDKEMVNYEKGVYNFLDEFIDKVWGDIESNYISIKLFFENKRQIKYSGNWDTYPKKNKIIALLDDYNEVSKENCLRNILSKTTTEVPKLLRTKASKIEKYQAAALEVKVEITEVFKAFLNEYDTKKMALATNLASGNKKLEAITENIKQSIEGLENGILSLENREDVIPYLSEDFTSDLNTYNDIRNWFESLLQQSNMSEHLNWLDSKLTDSETGSISTSDFNNAKLIKELLEKGLIKIEIEKTF